ncbi:hypothetical protein GIS00_15025 [Nakamurella sp. YIM 132087]|uniref:Type IV secretion protein Rhs n=1 Tax=Nakamurella alba TaxID=2665158 RepID=A0A7K1FPT5_9ACTN|nr:DUF6531 domain-containing protein [Nakamurella alba]MTD15253.1 hypothetical protein [Nakamurella alba]
MSRLGDPFVLGGSPGEIRSSATKWSGFSTDTSTAASDIRGLDSSEFVGDEADTYRSQMSDDLPPNLETTSEAWSMVASALTTYADTLESLQSQLSSLAADRDEQSDAVSGAQTAVSHAQTADSQHATAQAEAEKLLKPGETMPTDTYQPQTSGATADLSAKQAALQGTIDAANGIQSKHRSAVDTCVSKINEAKGMRFEDPPGWFDSLCSNVGDWIAEHADVLTAISSVLKTISGIAGVLALIPGLAPIMGPIALVTGAAAIGIDVAVKLATGEGSWTQIGLDALGLIPGVRAAKIAMGADIAVTSYQVATGEASPADLAMVVGLGALGARGGRGGRGGRAGDTGAGSPTTRTPLGDRTACGDPIDVVSGDMLLSHTDLTLPGVLPLVLRRTHLSSYRWGGGFGPSWASTLDQRLVRGAGDDLLFLTEDGGALLFEDALTLTEGESRIARWGIRRWALTRLRDGWDLTDPIELVTRRLADLDDAGDGRIEHIRDAHDNRIVFGYGDTGVLQRISHTGGYQLLIESDRGRFTGLSLADPAAPDGMTRVLSYGHGLRGLASIVNSSGLPLRLHYDDQARIVRWDDRNGIWYEYLYDEQSRCIRTAGRGRVLSYAFSYGLGRTTVTDSTGAVSVYEFNEDGQITRVVDPLHRITSYLRDSFDRLLMRTDAEGRTTQFVLDDLGRMLEVVHPDGSTVRIERDAHGRPVRTTDAEGQHHLSAFDKNGSLISETTPAGATSISEYAPTGAVSAAINALGDRVEIDTDAAGRIVAVTDALGRTSSYAYDAFGRQVLLVDPAGARTVTEWSVEGRPLRRTGPDGAQWVWAWDPEGNLLSRTDPAQGRTEYENGIFDLPVSRTDPSGARYLFAYDTELRLTTVTDPAGRRWRYVYDAAGQVVAETDFDGRTVGYTHDAVGRPTALTDARGETTGFAYDLAGDLVSRSTSAGTVHYRYDRRGSLIGADSGSVTVALTRDPAGRVIAETVNGRTVASTFDAAGRRTGTTLPSGRTSTRVRDATGRTVALGTAGREIRFGIDDAGRETRREFDAGAVLDSSYDIAGRRTAQAAGRHGDASGGPEMLTAREFRYRADGTPTGVHDRITGVARDYLLDPAGRVQRVDAAGWTEGYRYDGAGNITDLAFSMSAGAMPVPDGLMDAGGTREYDGTRVVRSGRHRYAYDADGRLVSRSTTRLSAKPAVTHFDYDAEDRLVGVRPTDGSTWTYTYDMFGRRLSKQQRGVDGTDGARTEFVWDGPTLVEQISTAADGTVTVTGWDYADDGLVPVAQHIARGGSDEFDAVVTDPVGTPTELVAEDGRSIRWRAPQATLWGSPLVPDPTTDPDRPNCPIRFAGQYADPESGLNYNRYRYYDPETARFTTPDPMGLQPAPDPHRYVDNPLREVDPSGLKCQDVAAGLQTRAADLQSQRERPWLVRNGTTAVVQVRHTETGEVRTLIATEAPTMPRTWEGQLRDGEQYVDGVGHAEQTILSHLDGSPEWSPTAGGTSRNVCESTCAPLITGSGGQTGGPTFPGVTTGELAKTPHRMFWWPS